MGGREVCGWIEVLEISFPLPARCEELQSELMTVCGVEQSCW